MPLTLTQVGTFVSNPDFYMTQIHWLIRAVADPPHNYHWHRPKISWLHLAYGIRPESQIMQEADITWLQGSK